MLTTESRLSLRNQLLGLADTRTWLILVVGSLAHLPFVVPQLWWLWNSDHYSFFPVAIAAFSLLVWDRLRDASVQPSLGLNKRALTLLATNLGILGLATLAGSTWLGWVSFLMFLWTAVHLGLDSTNAKLVHGVFPVLLLIVPLPLSLDTTIVVQLQKLATSQGSLLLDYFDVHHTVSGVAVRLPEKIFLIDDACSGIHSLFSALTTILVFCVYCRYAIVRTLAMLIQTVFWVLVANSLRVFVVVYAFARWNAGLESGWRHEMLGFAFYVLILLMALCTDQLIRYFFPPRVEEYGFKPMRKRSVKWLKDATGWLDQPFGTRTSSILSSCFIAGFVLIGLTTAVQAWQTPHRAAGVNHFDQSLALALDEQDAPEEVSGWRRVAFDRVNRDKSDAFGANSLIWTYENSGVTAQFSVDGAYPEFHDLSGCYTAIGWEIRQAQNLQLAGSVTGTEANGVATELQLYRGDSEQAYVLFTCVDSVGQIVAPPAPASTFTRNLLNRLRSGGLLGKEVDRRVVPPVIQLQGLVQTNTDFLGHERMGIRELFSALREAVGKRISAQAD